MTPLHEESALIFYKHDDNILRSKIKLELRVYRNYLDRLSKAGAFGDMGKAMIEVTDLDDKASGNPIRKTVVVVYDQDDDTEAAFAMSLDNHLPEEWDHIALEKLDIAGYWKE